MYIINPSPLELLTTLTASEEVATYEASKLRGPSVLPSKRWRSTTLFPYVVGQFDMIYTTLDYINTWYCNAQLSDWSRLRIAATQAGLTDGSAVYDVNSYLWPSSTGFFGACSFASTGDVNFTNILDQTTTSFSIQIRYKQVSSGAKFVIGKMATGASVGFKLQQTATDKMRVTIDDGVIRPTATSVANTSSSIFDAYTAVIDKALDELRLYRGETLQETTDITGLVSITSGAQPLYIAYDGTTRYDVAVDEFRFWSSALVAADLAVGGVADVYSELDVVNIDANIELYWRANESSGSTAIDDSSKSNDGTITNGTFSNPDPVASVDLSSYDYIHQKSIIASPVSASWFRIDYNFRNNTDGYVQAGWLPIATRNVMTHEASLTDIQGGRGVSEQVLAVGGLSRMPGGWKLARDFELHLTASEYYSVIRPLVRDRNFASVVGIEFAGPVNEVASYPMEFGYYGYLDIGDVVNEGQGYRMTGRIIEP